MVGARFKERSVNQGCPKLSKGNFDLASVLLTSFYALFSDGLPACRVINVRILNTTMSLSSDSLSADFQSLGIS